MAESIYEDKKFIDNLFLYYKLEDEITTGMENETFEKLEMASCFYYLSAIGRCVTRIDKLENAYNIRRTYLNYVHYNIDIIVTQLDYYSKREHLNELMPSITSLIGYIQNIASDYFKMSESKIAISNQYVHAYEIAIRKGSAKDCVYIQLGNLLLNYIKILTDRYYIDKLDRNDVSFDMLNEESNYVANKLRNIDNSLATRIELSIKMYANFRSTDSAIQQQQTKALQLALLAALCVKAFYLQIDTYVKLRKFRKSTKMLEQDVNKEIDKLKSNKEIIHRLNLGEGKRIVEQLDDEERLRIMLRDKRLNVFDKYNKEQEQKQEIKRERNRQIDSMSDEQFNETMPNLKNMVVTMSESLDIARNETIESQFASNEFLSHLFMAYDGLEAIKWMQN